MTNPEISKLGHFGLVSTDLEKSLWFFKEVIGLEETEEADGVHYLRAWGDFEHHTLTLRAGEESRLDHIAWRTKRPEDVDAFAENLQKEGIEINWVEEGIYNQVWWHIIMGLRASCISNTTRTLRCRTSH